MSLDLYLTLGDLPSAIYSKEEESLFIYSNTDPNYDMSTYENGVYVYAEFNRPPKCNNYIICLYGSEVKEPIEDFTIDTERLINEIEGLMSTLKGNIESGWLLDTLTYMSNLTIFKNKLLLDNVSTTYEDIIKLAAS